MKSFLKKLLPFFLTLLFISCANGLNNSASITINLPGAASRSVTEEELKSFTYSIDLVCPGNRTVNYSMNYGESKTISDLVPGTYKVIVSAYDGASKVYEGTDTVTVSAGKDAIAKIIMKAFVPFADALKARAVFKYDELEFKDLEGNKAAKIDMRSLFSENKINNGETIIVKFKGTPAIEGSSMAAQLGYVCDVDGEAEFNPLYYKGNVTLSGITFTKDVEVSYVFPINLVDLSLYNDNQPNTVLLYGNFNDDTGSMKDVTIEVCVYKAAAKVVGIAKSCYKSDYRDDISIILDNAASVQSNNTINITISGTCNQTVRFSQVQLNQNLNYDPWITTIPGTPMDNEVVFNQNEQTIFSKTCPTKDFNESNFQLSLQMIHKCDSVTSPLILFKDFSVEYQVIQ